jgi:AcrR family transcriptional regulator
MCAKLEKYHHGDLKNALIEAAIDILAEDGVQGLSLRKVASRAGVSHAAPYAHFTDKQALIAAVSTEGFRRLGTLLQAARDAHPNDPLRQLIEGGLAYIKFALDDPDHFRITLSGVVKKEKDYPALVQATAEAFGIVREIVSACQQKGILHPGDLDLMAVSVWGTIHGLVALVLDGQVSHLVLDRFSLQQMLVHSLSQYILVEIPPEYLSSDQSPINL